MHYKILLLDIDGTTVNNDPAATPTDKVVQSVIAAQTKLYVAVATGRPFSLAKNVVECLHLNGLGVFNDGAEIVDISTGRTIYRKTLSVDAIRTIVTIALPFGYNVYLHDNPNSKPIKDATEINCKSAQLLIEAVKKADLLPLLNKLSDIRSSFRSYEFRNARAAAAIYSTDSWKGADVVDVHIVHEFGTKKYGVERLLDMLNIAQEESIAIGDGQNDIPMLEASGLKIAMGNSPGEVKGVADYVAPSLADDGVAYAIEQFILKDSPAGTEVPQKNLEVI